MSHHRSAMFLVVMSLAVAAFSRSELSNGQQGQEELTGEYERSWALLIGVNSTPGLPTLNGVGDAEKMADVVREIGFNTKILRDPTYEQMQSDLYYAFPQMGRNDRYLVFFSGHGTEFERNDGTPEGYLLARNTKLQSLHTTAIPMADLKSIGLRVPAKHVVFIIDACFSGLAITKAGPKEDEFRAAPPSVKPLLQRRVVEILAAGTGSQKAYQVANQGLFTKSVIEAFRFLPEAQPTRPLTFTRLADWVRDEVSRASEGNLVPQPDRPVGVGEFVFRMPGSMPLQITGFLQVSTKLADVEIWLDGIPLGRTPLERQDVAVGLHRLRAEKAGFAKWERAVRVQPGTMTEAVVVLEPAQIAGGGTGNRDTHSSTGVGSRSDVPPSPTTAVPFSPPRTGDARANVPSRPPAPATVSLRSIAETVPNPFSLYQAIKAKRLLNGINNTFDTSQVSDPDTQLIRDHTTQRHWAVDFIQQEWSYEGAKTHIAALNARRFGGFSDWRLPTVEEAASLYRPRAVYRGSSLQEPDYKQSAEAYLNFLAARRSGLLHIDPVFPILSHTWTSDMVDGDHAWVVAYSATYNETTGKAPGKGPTNFLSYLGYPEGLQGLLYSWPIKGRGVEVIGVRGAN